MRPRTTRWWRSTAGSHRRLSSWSGTLTRGRTLSAQTDSARWGSSSAPLGFEQVYICSIHCTGYSKYDALFVLSGFVNKSWAHKFSMDWTHTVIARPPSIHSKSFSISLRVPLWVRKRVRWNNHPLQPNLHPLFLLRSSLPPGSPPPSHGGALGGAGRLVGWAGRGHGGHRVKAVRQLAPGHLHLEQLDHNHKARLLQLSTSNIWALSASGRRRLHWRLTQAGSMSSLARWETCVYIKSKHLDWLGLGNIFFTLSWTWSDHLSSSSTNE